MLTKFRQWYMPKTPKCLRWPYFDKAGIWFNFKGDEVCWTWPWRRKGHPKYISLEFSGTGEFGDARFSTLKELNQVWEEYFKTVFRE